MVGSYEESILRGRMSSLPSRPLDFLAQIGVLGLGKCPPALRCPRHVALSFKAFFYHYPATGHGRTRTDDGPSPYVGAIDLETGLLPRSGGGGSGGGGGAYRIPEKGQIQIIIKNQIKTAVKLFLVPYDLAGMEPGSKTFVRQRSYSAGVMDSQATTTTTTTNPLSATTERPTLRYLVHLNICCPARGRYYLHKDIRVVFANRVPDGNERLRTETTFPEPRFSPYKPATATANIATERDRERERSLLRRRSSGSTTVVGCVGHDLDDNSHGGWDDDSCSSATAARRHV